MKKRNILRGFCKANEYIARDEEIHFKFAVTLFTMVKERSDRGIGEIEVFSKTSIYNIIREAVECNTQFIRDIIQTDMIGLCCEDLIKYTKCTADALLVAIGYEKLYNETNPLDWMAVIALGNKTNFFEDKVSEYGQQNAEGVTHEDGFNFDENEYF